ncbi:MAG: DUF6789 family protein, partial [Nitrososphaerales archaeon]
IKVVAYGRGAKAGVVAGLVWGVIVAALLAALLTTFKTDVLSGISTVPGVNMTAEQLYTITLEFGVGSSIALGIIGGMILGAIFAAVYTVYLKSSSVRTRGVVFGIILWFVDLAFNGGGGSASGMEYFAISIAGYLVASLAYGYLLGYFFERFAPRGEPSLQEPKWPTSPPPSLGRNKADWVPATIPEYS